MGIDIDGGMIVGEYANKMDLQCEDLYDLLVEIHGMSCMSPWFDCGSDEYFFGYIVDDINVRDLDTQWLIEITRMAIKFEDMTGVPARLVGMQDVC